MEHTYKYESKYSKLSEEEKRKAQNATIRKWYNSLSPERKQKYLDMKREYAKEHDTNKYRHKECAVCHKYYANIYTHYGTKIHMQKLNDSQQSKRN